MTNSTKRRNATCFLYAFDTIDKPYDTIDKSYDTTDKPYNTTDKLKPMLPVKLHTIPYHCNIASINTKIEIPINK